MTLTITELRRLRDAAYLRRDVALGQAAEKALKGDREAQAICTRAVRAQEVSSGVRR